MGRAACVNTPEHGCERMVQYWEQKDTCRNFINSIPETHVFGSIPGLVRHLKTNVHARQGRVREPSYRSYQLPRGLLTF